jgi:hypothetical protein
MHHSWVFRLEGFLGAELGRTIRSRSRPHASAMLGHGRAVAARIAVANFAPHMVEDAPDPDFKVQGVRDYTYTTGERDQLGEFLRGHAESLGISPPAAAAPTPTTCRRHLRADTARFHLRTRAADEGRSCCDSIFRAPAAAAGLDASDGAEGAGGGGAGAGAGAGELFLQVEHIEAVEYGGRELCLIRPLWFDATAPHPVTELHQGTSPPACRAGSPYIHVGAITAQGYCADHPATAPGGLATRTLFRLRSEGADGGGSGGG